MADGEQSELKCNRCQLTVPVKVGIPRFVKHLADNVMRRTQASFGYEWTHFSNWEPSGEVSFQDYFGGLDLSTLRAARVLDAGCGMGRHARLMADSVAHLVAVDFSHAIDQAARNVADRQNVDCVQADLLHLPFDDETFDYVYSIGVLHHLPDTSAALRRVVAKVKQGGRVRVYLYWKRSGMSGALLSLAGLCRRITTRLPFSILRTLCWFLSIALTVSIVWPYRLATKLGISAHKSWPLFAYTKYPFTVLYNDQFDRFSAPLERRFDSHEVKTMLEDAGLGDVQVCGRFGWVAEGLRLR
jgi:SAM-dependent methyltransferase